MAPLIELISSPFLPIPLLSLRLSMCGAPPKKQNPKTLDRLSSLALVYPVIYLYTLFVSLETFVIPS